MRLGSNIYLIFFSLLIFSNLSFADEKISTTPLINIDEIKPSFEDLNDNENISSQKKLKEKKNAKKLQSSQAIIIGLDKITAKSSELVINLNENKKYGPLEIRF